VSRPRLIVWGAGGHATVVADAVRLAGEYEIAGFLDDGHPERRGTPFCGATILGGAEQLPRLHEEGTRHLVLGFGLIAPRMERAEVARQAGFSFPRILHPRATVAADTEIGAGTVLAAGSILCPGVRLGEHVIVNTSASVDHGSRLEDHVHLSAGVRLGAEVAVGRGVLVGMAATVMSRVRIGEGAVVGAGALVLEDVPASTVARGVPARIFALERA
jgi:sugar O-acyltransferase (sialic acid O-acetyltransferase NeuD family)